MNTNLLELITFVCITIFTPGPNNISSASMGVLYGYRITLNYMLGIALGFFLMMMISSFVSSSILILFPTVEIIIRYVGAIYILYLAGILLKSSYDFNAKVLKPLTYTSGFMLQLLNPKSIVFGFTVFSVFLTPISTDIVFIVFAAFILTILAFCATSSWALFGTLIRRYLHKNSIKMALNISLSLLLTYTAFQIAFT